MDGLKEGYGWMMGGRKGLIKGSVEGREGRYNDGRKDGYTMEGDPTIHHNNVFKPPALIRKPCNNAKQMTL